MAASAGTRQTKGSSDVRSKIPAKDSDGAAKRLTAEEKGKAKAAEGPEVELMDIDAARETFADPFLVRTAKGIEDPLGLYTLWHGPPGEGREAQM